MNRIYHTWDKWECYPFGFWNNKHKNKSYTDIDCKKISEGFLRDIPLLESSLQSIVLEWKYSCEHVLTNEKTNRLFWLIQAATCYSEGIPSKLCVGYHQLSSEEQSIVNASALKFLNQWLIRRGEPALTEEQSKSTSGVNVY